MEEKMKEYKSKFTKMMFETLLGLCASWFVYNLACKLTHSFLFAVIGAAAVLAFFLIKVFYTDFISIILTEDKKMVVKRCNKVINIFDIEQYDDILILYTYTDGIYIYRIK